MKKVITVIFSFVFVLSVASCGKSDKSKGVSQNISQNDNTSTDLTEPAQPLETRILMAELGGTAYIFKQGTYSFDMEDFFKQYDELINKTKSSVAKEAKKATKELKSLKKQYLTECAPFQMTFYSIGNQNSYEAIINLEGENLKILNYEAKDMVFDSLTSSFRINVPLPEAQILRLRGKKIDDKVNDIEIEITSNEPLYAILQKGVLKLDK